jgi:hypothetical protein
MLDDIGLGLGPLWWVMINIAAWNGRTDRPAWWAYTRLALVILIDAALIALIIFLIMFFDPTSPL